MATGTRRGTPNGTGSAVRGKPNRCTRGPRRFLVDPSAGGGICPLCSGRDYTTHHHRDPEGYGDLDLAALLDFVSGFRRAFPNLQDSIDFQVAEGDIVVTRFTSTGTQLHPWQTIRRRGGG